MFFCVASYPHCAPLRCTPDSLRTELWDWSAVRRHGNFVPLAAEGCRSSSGRCLHSSDWTDASTGAFLGLREITTAPNPRSPTQPLMPAHPSPLPRSWCRLLRTDRDRARRTREEARTDMRGKARERCTSTSSSSGSTPLCCSLRTTPQPTTTCWQLATMLERSYTPGQSLKAGNRRLHVPRGPP